MSHFTKLNKANITSIVAFVKAMRELGYTQVTENATKITAFDGKSIDVDCAVKTGQYDVGLQKNNNDTYDMVADWWGIVRDEIPSKMRTATKGSKRESDVQDAILKYTTKHAIVDEYTNQGYTVQCDEDEEQSFNLVLTKY